MQTLVVMGVAGCGKSSLGAAVAAVLRCPLIEGDDFHSEASQAKMRAGIALSDADRAAWLDVLGRQLALHPNGAVLTCSSLKRSYRDRLRAAAPGLRFAWLDLDQSAALARVAQRGAAHLFPPSLVASQFDALEPPTGEANVLRLDALQPTQTLCDQVIAWISPTTQDQDMPTIDPERLARLFPHAGDIPKEHQLAAPVHQRRYVVGGEILEWSGACKTVLSPICTRSADGAIRQVEIGSYPVMDEARSDAVLEAAVTAYDNGRGQWPTMTVAERIACMQDFVRQMVAQREPVVRLIMWEIGKSLADSAKEFDRTVEYISATIEALKELDNASSRFVIAEGTIGQIRRTPLGVVLCMGPYNYPLNETFATLIPALLMGNTVVFKPPQYGALLFEPLLDAFRSAFPKGVINTVYAPGEVVVPRMLASGKVNVLALIGSSRVADHLKKQHPKSHRLRAILGLDAKNAAIILPDADLELTVKECLLGALSFNGQRCTALKMLIVHRSIAEPFLRRFTEALAKLKVGMPWERGVNITPLPGLHRTAYMTEAIDDAKAKGARIVNEGGGTFCQTLFYPAVVYPVKEGMKLYREEQFGPLIPVMPYDDVQTALDYVITSEHGQQVSIFGSDPAQIGALVDPLVNQVCRVNINAQCQRGPDVFPFAGRKDSAEGTLSVSDALRAFSIRSMVAAKSTEPSKKLLDDIVQQHRSKFISTGFIF